MCDAVPARRARMAVSLGDAAASATLSLAAQSGDTAVAASEAAAVRVRESFTLQFSGRCANEPRSADAGSAAAPTCDTVAPELAATPAAASDEPRQSISEWLQDERRAAAHAAKRKTTEKPAPPPEAKPQLPLSLKEQRALARREAAAAPQHGDAPQEQPQLPRKARRAEAAPCTAAATSLPPQSDVLAACTFDFRAARARAPAAGSLTLARKSAIAARGDGGADARKAPAAAAQWPFAAAGGDGGKEHAIKPGARSASFPRSGNRVYTFT